MTACIGVDVLCLRLLQVICPLLPARVAFLHFSTPLRVPSVRVASGLQYPQEAYTCSIPPPATSADEMQVWTYERVSAHKSAAGLLRAPAFVTGFEAVCADAAEWFTLSAHQARVLPNARDTLEAAEAAVQSAYVSCDASEANVTDAISHHAVISMLIRHLHDGA